MVEAQKQNMTNAGLKDANCKKRKSCKYDRVAICFSLAFLLGVGICINAFYAQLGAKGVYINDLRRDISDLAAENENLSLEIARLSALDRVEKIAQNDLGMIQPQGFDIMYVASEELEGLITTYGVKSNIQDVSRLDLTSAGLEKEEKGQLNDKVSEYIFGIKYFKK